MKYAAAAKRPHGGIWREASHIIHSGRGPTAIRKCKAHQNISALEGEEKVTALGNDGADKRAKAALAKSTSGETFGKRSSTRITGLEKWLANWARGWRNGPQPTNYLVSSRERDYLLKKRLRPSRSSIASATSKGKFGALCVISSPGRGTSITENAMASLKLSSRPSSTASRMGTGSKRLAVRADFALSGAPNAAATQERSPGG